MKLWEKSDMPRVSNLIASFRLTYKRFDKLSIAHYCPDVFHKEEYVNQEAEPGSRKDWSTMHKATMILLTIGTLAGRHMYFAKVARRMWGRFLPSSVADKVMCTPAKAKMKAG